MTIDHQPCLSGQLLQQCALALMCTGSAPVQEVTRRNDTCFLRTVEENAALKQKERLGCFYMLRAFSSNDRLGVFISLGCPALLPWDARHLSVWFTAKCLSVVPYFRSSEWSLANESSALSLSLSSPKALLNYCFFPSHSLIEGK